ncbi:MAG TPA: hypothetical protein DCO89_00595 [Clostridiales bacterium]|nr:hypothetical protein [Clostridiales bacterium]
MASILNIGPRLEAVVDLCPKAKIIADIGCDHGYVTAELVLQNKTDMVIATEKSEQCLNKAITLVDSLNIMPFVSFRLGDGFGAITKHDKIKVAVISGMGGDEIIHILENKPKGLFNFVLQPMKDLPLLRHYLNLHGYKILVDKLVKENDKFYNVISVTHGKEQLSDLELYFGKTNFTDNYEVFYDYLITRQKQLADFKSKVGQLASKLQEEYDNIAVALELFEDSTAEDSAN